MKKQLRFLRKFMSSGILIAATLFAVNDVQAAPVKMYAMKVINFSSQWMGGGWTANEALGEPNTFSYGDIPTAWSPNPINGTLEYITVEFENAVYATGVTIRETFGNGFVTRIDLLDLNNIFHTVWTGVDPSQPGSPVDFTLTWAVTDYLVNGVRVYVDTNHNLNAWEEIDSIQLHGNTISQVPLPAAAWLFGSALIGMARLVNRKKTVA